MTSSLAERPLIKTDDELASLCAELRAAGRFALDTEFVGERTYIPRLCLVQIATTEFIALVDTLAIKNLAPLWDIVADPSVEKVLHAAREDLRLAYFGGGKRLPQGIFDTQVAAGFIGLPAYPLSYARLVEALMGTRLSKGETRSEWEHRPLSPDQLAYARDDVRYLLPVADKLSGLLARMERMEWMREEMGRFSAAPTYETEPREAYLRLRAARSGFGVRPTALLRELAAWRETEAMARDIPVRSLVRDELLIELALRPPRRLTDFRRVRGFPEGEEVSLGPPLLDALMAGRALTEDQMPPPLSVSGADETPMQRAMADLLYALGEGLCLTRDLAPELALTKADTQALARGLTQTPLLAGWRRSALGGELARLAVGQTTARVSVVANSLSIVLEN